MNRKTIQKIINELVKDKPDVSYIRGILETLLESLPEEKINTQGVDVRIFKTTGSGFVDEATMLENEAKAKLKSIEGTINKSITME